MKTKILKNSILSCLIKGTVTNYWKPGKNNWFEAYSFYIVEYDGNATPWEELTLFGQKFGKQFLSSSSPNWLSGSLEALDVAGKLLAKWIRSEDDKIGYAYLNYYDNPFRQYKTNSAEKEGWLTIQFSNNSDANIY